MTVQTPKAWADEGYEHSYAKLFELEPVRAMFDQVIAAADLADDVRVLDLGGGTGFLLRSLALHGLKPAVTEVDSSPRMLLRAHRVSYAGPVQFCQADLNDPAAWWGARGKFDRVIAVNSLYLLADPAATLRQAARLAEPGARLVVSTPRAQPSMEAILQAHLAWVASQGADPTIERIRILREFSGIIGSNRTILARQDFHFPNEAQLESWFAPSWHLQSVQTTYANQNWLAVATRG